MKFSTALLIFVIASNCEAAAFRESEPMQSRVSFEAAIRNHSTAPPYVLITVIDAQTELARTTCTTVNLLMGAIDREYELGYDNPNQLIAEQIALSNNMHVFRFTKQDALHNIPITYSEFTLESMRLKLALLSIEELRSGFSLHGNLHSFYQGKPTVIHNANRDAVACVLIERGLSPGMGDRSDQLWLAPEAISH